ncbi:MAG: AI-2E family transporter [Anaerolineaceae bacterium]
MSLPSNTSPHWNWTTKLLVASTFIAITAFLLVRFNNMLGPLLMVAILCYLIYPLANHLRNWLKMSWRVSVTIIFLLLVLLFAGLLTWGGFAIVEQTQNLIEFLNKTVNDLPRIIADLQTKSIVLGPFVWDLGQIDLTALSTQILSWVEPLLGNLGGLVGGFASGAATGLGWFAFIMLVSYFILAETGGNASALFTIEIPGYRDDINRMVEKLGHIWNSFLRGQLIIILITIILYTILLSAIGVHFALGLAALAGLARLVPYVGPAVAWITYALVALFQEHTIFGLSSWGYVVLVVGVAMIFDYILDNFVNTKIMSNALKVHPATVLIAALVGANLIGFMGILLAAPVLASLKLFTRYAMRKMFDLDPWQGIEEMEAVRPLPPLARYIQVVFLRLYVRIRNSIKASKAIMGFLHGAQNLLRRVLAWAQNLFQRLRTWFRSHIKSKTPSEPVDDPPVHPEE